MKELQTILGTDIPINTRGIVYLCHFYHMGEPPKLTVVREILCEDSFHALTLYSEIPHPPSQLVMGKTFDELIINLHKLHEDMKNPIWLNELAETL